MSDDLATSVKAPDSHMAGSFLMLPDIYAINGKVPYHGIWTFFVACPCCGHAVRFNVNDDGSRPQRRSFH